MQSGTCHSLFQPSCAVAAPHAGQPEQPRSDTAVRDPLGALTQPWGLPPWSLHLLWLWPSPSPTSLLHCLRGAEPPSLLTCFIPRHVVGKHGSVAQREDDGTTGKAERQASEPSLPPAAHRTTYLSSIEKPGNIHMETSHFWSRSTGFFSSCALHPVDHTASCFSTAE